MTNQMIKLSEEDTPSGWSVIASFDAKNRLIVNEGNKDDDFYIQVSAGDIGALSRVLKRTCKPRINSGNPQSDILKMIEIMFAGKAGVFAMIENFLKENGVPFRRSHWIGA